jgi:hypothetical protein
MANEARFIRADRVQTHWDFVDLEALLSADHRARVVMSFVESLDLQGLYDSIKSREGEPGRPPPDPAVLLARGFTRPLRGLARRDSLSDLRNAIWRIGGSPAGCR